MAEVASSLSPDTAFVPLSENGIDGFEAVGVDNTALALAKCEKYVLKPYKNILKILGWTSFVESPRTPHRLCHMAVIAVWTLVIIIAMVTQIMSCFRRDSFLPGTVVTMNSSMNSCSEVREIQCKNHVISAFILTDILLLSSYFFGVYLFSRDEAEYLSKLADQVFIKSNKAGQNSAANRLVGTIVLYFLCGIVWVVLSIGVRIMTTYSVDMWNTCTWITWSKNVRFKGVGKNSLIVLDLIGFVSFDIVYVAAVMNYAAQSEMNIFLLKAVRKIIEDKRYGNTQLDSSIKDILECRKYIHVLNGKTATATALIMFNLGSAGIVAIVSLNDIRFEQARRPTLRNVELATVAAAFNVVLWITLVSFPFIQAGRVTDACLHVKASGPEVRARPQLYSSSPQLELDSFVSFTEAVRLKATIFGIPIYLWMWWVVFAGISFTALILFQTGVYSFTIYL